MEDVKTTNETEDGFSIRKERQKVIDENKNIIMWELLALELSKLLRCSFMEVMQSPSLEVLGYTYLMKGISQIKEMEHSMNPNSYKNIIPSDASIF